MIETPELDKQQAVIESGASATLTNFYDWLQEQGYWIARYQDVGWQDEQLCPVSKSPEQLFADFFDIDLDKIESERRAILDTIREQNA